MEAASHKTTDQGFGAAWWLAGCLAFLGLAEGVPGFADWIKEPQWAPIVIVLCFLGATICFAVGLIGMIQRQVKLRWPIDASPIVNLSAIAFAAILISAVYTLHPIEVTYGVFQSAANHSRPPLVQPRLTAQDRVHITLGNMNMGEMHWLDNGASLGGVGFGGFFPIRPFLKDGRVCIDADVFTGSLPPHLSSQLRINCNAIVRETLPWGWDYNSNERTLEVVNSNGAPTFQLIFDEPYHVIINGYFPIPDDEVWLIENSGLNTLGEHFKLPVKELPPLQIRDDAGTIKPAPSIFKYPAWKYPGQMR